MAKNKNRITGQEYDNLFKIPVFMDVAHHEVHEGDTYSAIISDPSAADTKVVQGYIKTPAVADPQKRMHLTLSHGGSGAHSFSITEGITYSAGGTARAPVNRRRDSANTTSAQTVKVGSDKDSDVITYTGGTVIWEESAGAGRGTGGETRGVTEWILAPNTEYIFQVFSGATSTAITLSAIWYEHTDSL